MILFNHYPDFVQRLMVNFDTSVLDRRGSDTIFVVSLLHLYQAYMGCFEPLSRKATCLRALYLVFHLVYPPDGVVWVYLFMFSAIGLALIGLLFKIGFIRLALFLPQHLVLGIMAWGGFFASQSGMYLDGTKMDWQHISVDQGVYIALFLAHSRAILRRAKDG